MTKLDRIADIIVQQKNLSSPSEITKISDADILRMPGLGRKTLDLVRQAYPYDASDALKEARSQLRRTQMELKKLKERRASLGSIHHATAVRLSRGASEIFIQTAGSDPILEIHLRWAHRSGYPEEDFGFGEITPERLSSSHARFPSLSAVENVSCNKIEDMKEFEVWSLLIETYFMCFEIDLYRAT